MPADQLLKTYGGDVDFVYEHEAYWPALNELAARRREEQVERWVKGGKMIGEMEGYIRGGEQKCLREMEEEEGVGARMKGGLESVGR